MQKFIGEELKTKRTIAKKTQVEMAKAVGVSLQAYRWWEQGVSNPKPENLIKLKFVLQNNENIT